MENFFQGKNALVVGGSGGIGKEISLALASLGANVTVHGGHKSPRFDALTKKINSLSPKNSSIVLNFEDLDLKKFDEKKSSEKKDSPLCAFKKALSTCDILCICYGPFLQKPLEKNSASEWLSVTRLNLALPGILTSKALPFMKRRGFGRILYFGGTRTHSINGFLTNAAYASAKTGISSLVKSVALQHAKDGIAAAAIMPGFVQTEYVSQKKRAEYERLSGQKMLSAKDISQKALFLLSSPGLNGVLLNVDGGWKG